jgi:predicted alpha/beta hydrolase family esterase
VFPPQGFDFGLINSKAAKLAFVHGDDDPYCPLQQAEYLAGEWGAPLTVIPHGGHLGSRYTEFPELWEILRPLL